MLICRVMRDDGSMLAYQIAMRQLDRTERTLRVMRQRMFYGPSHFDHVVGRIIQVAIDRAVSKRIRLSTDWWKWSTRLKKR
jgi:hypothetical protein